MTSKLRTKLFSKLSSSLKDGLIINILTIIFAIMCFIPVYVNSPVPVDSSNNPTVANFSLSNTTKSVGDDYDYYNMESFDKMPFFREAAISTLIITLPSAIDAMLDIIPDSILIFIFGDEYRSRVKMTKGPIFHLTLLEKWLYLIGVTFLSTITFDPVLNYSDTSAVFSATTTLYICFQNASTVLLLCPVLSFLTRCCPTWTPLRSLFLASLICIASLLSSLVTLVDPASSTATNLTYTTNVILCICCGLYLCMIALSAANTFYFHKRYPDDVRSHSNTAQQHRIISEERFRNVVIAAHMTTNFFDLVLNTVWYFYSLSLTGYSLGIFLYCIVAFAVIIFVTEIRGRKHAAIVAMNALLDSKKAYVRYISHELRTPMNAAFLGLKYIIDNIKDHTESNPETAEAYETLCDVQTACSTAVDVLNDLLTFEKLESGILELHKMDVCVMDLVRDCMSVFSAQAREKDIKLVCEVEVTETDRLLVDKFKIDQVLRNLISNAIKFSEKGGTVKLVAYFITSPDVAVDAGRPRSSPVPDIEAVGANEQVTAKLPPSMGNLVIKVIDEGAGISHENQKRLFKEVVQFNPEKLQAGGGSGFGLYICKGIVDLHNGKLSAFSAGEGMGTTFTLELPMARSAVVSRNDSSSSISSDVQIKRFGSGISSARSNSTISIKIVPTASTKSLQQASLRSSEVLVVDDSPMNRKMVVKILKAAGYKCVEAEDGLEAIEKVKRRMVEPPDADGHVKMTYDAVLMDFVMPNMDGPTATKELRKLGYKGLIFGLTGNGLESDVNHFEACGANKVLVKPFKVEEFRELMNGTFKS